MEDSFARTRVFVVGGCSQGLWFAAQLAALLLCMSKYLSPVIDANACLFRFGGRTGKQRFLGLGLPDELMGGGGCCCFRPRASGLSHQLDSLSFLPTSD